ncbi:MAG TPA: ABC transporter permease [Tetrasphaera sp.]|uniref:ABC transporter permease n=1 Tax=Nostocoides sp. TaxID=1917966 RepID=UPI002C449D81|nr:ABC transporter permease [Tetrasphaera sp.]HNQ08062.1 ABC transporter permease [Tetrasphaera sp.]
MNGFVALARAQWKGFWRDKQNWFWLMAFPLMFLVLFGFLFRDAGVSKSTLTEIGSVAVIDQLPAEARSQFDNLFEVTKTTDSAKALEEVRKGDVDAAVEQRGNEVILHYSQADQVKAATVRGTLGAFVDGANVAASGKPPAFTLNATAVEDESLKPIQFIAPGLLGWAVAMGAVFNAAMPFVNWRTNKLLRRIRLAPVRTEALVASRLLVSIAVAFVQMGVFLAVGVGLFDLRLTGSWWMAVPLLLCATLAFMAIGLIAGAISKTAEAASGIANVIIMPMAFLSGSFIPLDQAPGWLQTVSKFLPLGQLNQGLLDTMVRGDGPGAALVPMAALLGFALVFGLIAARVFRWED